MVTNRVGESRIAGLTRSVSRRLYSRFTPQQRSMLEDEVKIVHGKFGIKNAPLPRIETFNFVNQLKSPLSLVELAAGCASSLLGYPEVLYFVIGINLTSLFAGGMATGRVKFGDKIIQGQRILIGSFLPEDIMRGVVAHETVHCLRRNGFIKDDRVAEAAFVLRQQELGLP